MIPVDVENRFIKVLAGIAGALAVSVVCYLAGHREGSRQAHAEDATRYAAELAKAEKAYREKEDEHAKTVERLRLDYARVDSKENGKDATVARELGTGARRLRVRAASCPDVPAPRPATGRVDAPPTCELAPEVGERLYQLAADADATARQLAALQEWAISAVKLCNGAKP